MNEKSTDYYTPQWPDHLPDEWEFVRTDWVATEHRETTDPTSLNHEQVFHYSIPIIEETGDGRYDDPTEIRSKKLILEGGEVLVSKLNPRKSRVLQTKNHSPLSIASGEFIPLRANEDIVLPKYLETVFLSEPVRQYLDGIATSATRSHQRVNPQEIRTLRFPKPPVDTQRKILSYLSYNTDRIDALIEKNQRLLELLEEKRRSTISETTTIGLDYNVAKKDSGTQWWGEIPAHWEISRLNRLRKNYTPIVYGIILPGPNQDEGVPIIKGGDCKPEKLDPKLLSKTTPEIASEYDRSKLKAGDLVYEIRGSIGRVVKVPAILEGANLTQDTARISPKSDIDEDWLLWTLRSEPFRQQMKMHSLGATVEGVNLEDLRRGILPVPPLDEQEKLAKYLHDVNEDIDSLVNRVTKLINLLKEKRQSLITAAVTGQINVSDWEPPSEETEVPA